MTHYRTELTPQGAEELTPEGAQELTPEGAEELDDASDRGHQ